MTDPVFREEPVGLNLHHITYGDLQVTLSELESSERLEEAITRRWPVQSRNGWKFVYSRTEIPPGDLPAFVREQKQVRSVGIVFRKPPVREEETPESVVTFCREGETRCFTMPASRVPTLERAFESVGEFWKGHVGWDASLGRHGSGEALTAHAFAEDMARLLGTRGQQATYDVHLSLPPLLLTHITLRHSTIGQTDVVNVPVDRDNWKVVDKLIASKWTDKAPLGYTLSADGELIDQEHFFDKARELLARHGSDAVIDVHFNSAR